jgi:hypothetical protein
MFRSEPLYRPHELTVRTIYSDLKQRAGAAGDLLPGTPGTLVKRTTAEGYEYWYRSYYPIPKRRAEVIVGRADDAAAYDSMRQRMNYAAWAAKQVAALSKLGFQSADKEVAAVLVELHNRHVFEAGLIVVGTLAYMSWLNEYGAIATAARTQDIDLARGKTLKLAATVPFLSSMMATQLPFHRIPGLPSHNPSTSVKLRGTDALHVDILAPGPMLGGIIEIPELDWPAQTIPFYDYLLEDAHSAAMLAGGHCIPIKLPNVRHMVWHKLYSSMQRKSDPAKAEKDLIQAATLAAILIEQDSVDLKESYCEAPQALREATVSRMPRIRSLLSQHPQALDAFDSLSGG